MSLVMVGPLAELPANAPYAFQHEGLEVVLVRCEEGVFALEDVCSHAEVALSEGEVRGCHIECWMHGSAFDVRTGMPDALPATRPVRTFPVSITEQDGTPMVFVEIG